MATRQRDNLIHDVMPARRADNLVHEERPLRLAVIGLGYWGPNLVRVLNELPGAHVVAAYDIHSDAVAKIVQRYPSVRAGESYDEILADESIDAVAIATPISTHFELAAAALESGKHVFVEKPLAGSSEQARALIGLAEREQRTLMPGHTFLYSPPVMMGRELIESGDLGDIYFITTSRVNLGLHQRDASVVWDLGPHDFSILRHWLDEVPVRVSAMARSCLIEDTPDVAFIDLEFESGTIAHVELSWLAPSKLRRTVIVGSSKMVIYDDMSTEPIRIFDAGAELRDPETFGEFRLSYRTGDIVSPRVEVVEPLQLEFTDFCEAVRSGREPRSDAQLGLDVVRIVEAVERSLEEGGAPIPVEAAAQMASRSGIAGDIR
jgi:predicted dehydrogenase